MRTLLTLFILLLHISFTSAQTASGIRAGIVDSNMTHFVLSSPDSIICIAPHAANHIAFIFIDLNRDRINDFRLLSRGSGGLGGSSRSLDLYPYNARFNVFTAIDSVFNPFNPPGSQYLKMIGVKAFNLGDTISASNASVSSTSETIFTSNVSHHPNASYTNFYNAGDLYVGFFELRTGRRYYGWIKVEQNTNGTLYVKEWAYQNGLITDLNEVSLESSSFKVYPNPVDDLLRLEGSLNLQLNAQVFSLDGKLLFDGVFPTEGLDVSDYDAGVYMINIIEENGISNLKFIKN